MELQSNVLESKNTPIYERVQIADIRKKAFESHHAGEIDEAIMSYKICLKANPKDIGLWSNLGAALRKKKQYQAAIGCYHRALEVDPDDLAVLGNLANALKDLHRLRESIEIHEKLLSLIPNDISTLMNAAAALREAGEFSRALKLLNTAKEIEPSHAGVEWERSQHLLYLGQYQQGWEAYEARWKTGDLPPCKYSMPQWQGEPLKNKRIVIHAEQGYGDTILASRFIAQVKGLGGHIIFICKQELHRLFKHIPFDELLSVLDDTPQADFHCPLMSLMGILKITPTNIPAPPALYTSSNDNKFTFINKQSKGFLKVGIVWSGSITFGNNENRALKAQDFLPLLEIENIRLFSLQKGPCAQQLQQTGADALIEPLGDLCDDFADTATAINQLDVIVMTDSSVAHLAASLGKPVINLLQKVPYWLYNLEATTTPWYTTMQLIKQEEHGEWLPVINKAKEQLTLLNQKLYQSDTLHQAVVAVQDQ